MAGNTNKQRYTSDIPVRWAIIFGLVIGILACISRNVALVAGMVATVAATGLYAWHVIFHLPGSGTADFLFANLSGTNSAGNPPLRFSARETVLLIVSVFLPGVGSCGAILIWRIHPFWGSILGAVGAAIIVQITIAYDRKMKSGYFECEVPKGDGLCSDNDCPCNDEVIPRGTGYLYITQELVDFRRDCPLEADAEFAMRSRMLGLMTGYGFAHIGGLFRTGPILVCKRGALLRDFDLDIAAADARRWWRTGRVPLRATPRNPNKPKYSMGDQRHLEPQTEKRKKESPQVTANGSSQPAQQMEMEREGNVLVKFRCESCGKKIGVPEKYAGKKARCPGCQKTITIPVQTMISSPAVAESALSQPRGNAYVSPTAGLKELEMTCLRDDLLYEYTYVEKATDMIASEGADAAKGLANLVWELLACRSPKIENALTACTKAAPLPELLEAIAAVARAPSLTSPPGNARFLPQIAGGGKIGWDDGMASRIRKYAREVFASVKERIKGG